MTSTANREHGPRKSVRRRRSAGHSLIEVMIAMLLLLCLGAAFTQGLATAWRLERDSAAVARAVELAAEEMERLHAGSPAVHGETIGPYTRSSSATADGPLTRFEVVIDWHDPEPRNYTLVALARQP